MRSGLSATTTRTAPQAVSSRQALGWGGGAYLHMRRNLRICACARAGAAPCMLGCGWPRPALRTCLQPALVRANPREFPGMGCGFGTAEAKPASETRPAWPWPVGRCWCRARGHGRLRRCPRAVRPLFITVPSVPYADAPVARALPCKPATYLPTSLFHAVPVASLPQAQIRSQKSGLRSCASVVRLSSLE